MRKKFTLEQLFRRPNNCWRGAKENLLMSSDIRRQSFYFSFASFLTFFYFSFSSFWTRFFRFSFFPFFKQTFYFKAFHNLLGSLRCQQMWLLRLYFLSKEIIMYVLMKLYIVLIKIWFYQWSTNVSTSKVLPDNAIINCKVDLETE